MAEGFSLLWNQILDSSVWDYNAATRVVWITMLAMKNRDGFVKSTFSGLVRNANVSVEECRVALGIFLSPDDESSSKNDGGRRIREVEGGWFIINHEKYQYSSEEKREYWRRVKAEHRRKAELKKKGRLRVSKKGTPLVGEQAYEAAVKRGDGSEEHVAQTVEREMLENREGMPCFPD